METQRSRMKHVLCVGKFRQHKERNYCSESSSREHAATNTHIKMLIKHIKRKIPTSIWNAAIAVTFVVLYSRAGQKPKPGKSLWKTVGSWKNWMGWRVRTAGRVVFALRKDNKILIWIMSQIKRNLLSGLHCQSKNPTKTTAVFTDGWLLLRTTEPLPLQPCQIYTGKCAFFRKRFSALCSCVIFTRNTATFWQAYCLRQKQPMGILDRKSN